MKIIEEHIVMLKEGKVSGSMQRVMVVDTIEMTKYYVKIDDSHRHHEISRKEFLEADKRLYDWLFPKWWLRKYRKSVVGYTPPQL